MRTDIETDRLFLRPWADDDAQWLNELHRERGEQPETLEETERIVERIVERAAVTGICVLPVVLKEDGAAIGYCGLIEGRSSVDEPEIAYELFAAHRGRGYATEAGEAVVAAARDTGRQRLWATVGDWNAPSFRVLEKLGFERSHTTEGENGTIVWLTRAL